MKENCNASELVQALLSSSQAVYTLLARLWAGPLDEATFTTLASPEWEEVLSLLDEQRAEDEKGIEGGQSLNQVFTSLTHTAQQLGVEHLKSAFNWCFMGLGTKVAPWESVYVANERLIMQPSTLAVREAYAAAGFVAQQKGSEPDDHLATECDFMAKLSGRALETFGAGNIDTCLTTIGSMQAFLGQHLCAWSTGFSKAFTEAADKARPCDKERASDAEAFYGALACFDALFFDVDLAALNNAVNLLAD